jgi:hypothetical protein
MSAPIETAKYDLLYGKVLAFVGEPIRARELTNALYQIGEELGLSHADLVKYIGKNGLQFDNNVYAMLNQARTNSSQIGFLDEGNIPGNIRQQVV